MLIYMTKYSEIADLPDGNVMFIHYEEKDRPVWIEYLNRATDKSVKYYQRSNGTRKRRLRKRENYTHKLSHRANSLLPSVGTW